MTVLPSENLIICRENINGRSVDDADLTCELNTSDIIDIMSALESPPTMPAAWSTTVEPWVATSANVNVHPHIHHHYQPYPHQGRRA